MGFEWLTFEFPLSGWELTNFCQPGKSNEMSNPIPITSVPGPPFLLKLREADRGGFNKGISTLLEALQDLPRICVSLMQHWPARGDSIKKWKSSTNWRWRSCWWRRTYMDYTHCRRTIKRKQWPNTIVRGTYSLWIHIGPNLKERAILRPWKKKSLYHKYMLSRLLSTATGTFLTVASGSCCER